MKGLSTSKVSTEDYIRELKLLAHHIQETHGEALKSLQHPVLLLVELPNAQSVAFLISSEGIVYKEKPPAVENRITVGYRDLLRLVEKPSKIVRYVLEGRLRISGDYKQVISSIQRLF
ncbi:MAG: SCP2 sterol-binding domain-containing protein [Aquificaceae bacterium]|nr:SCP2 sterol-binding domain-containing protein [Aquificaceae bacterium]MCS7277957.1 SCP2 sterol-binding domain-containing protein [Aquificaceae bacterium]MDW8424075.1 SCP2 sterol-binding domain-containing protein [Aquificaceae bacterium]